MCSLVCRGSIMRSDSPSFNIQFVNLIRRHPVLYSASNMGMPAREEQDETWEKVAREVGETVFACKEKWKNLRGCYTRDIRWTKKMGKTKKPYYLAEHMEFIKPYLKIKDNQAADHPIKEEYNTTDDSAAIDEDDYAYDRGSAMDDDESCCYPDANGEGATSGRTPGDMVECLVVIEEPDASKYGPESSRSLGDDEKPRKKRRREDSLETRVTGSSDVPLEAHSTLLPEKPERWRRGRTEEEELEDADLSFFKSLFPDLKKMTPRQKNRFKASVLNCIDDILFKDAKDEISES